MLSRLPASLVTLMLCSVMVARALAATRSPTPIPPVARLGVVASVSSCADLAKVDLTEIGGVGSRVVSAGEHSSSGMTICSVQGLLAPSIGFRIDLPVERWAQRYLQVGCGGLCGRILLQVDATGCCASLNADGFAIASTDMGHEGKGGDFGRDPQKRVDFAYRAVHLTSVASKALIRKFYGSKEAYAYFAGCSDGGREALIEAERFAEDFNGIIAGAPAMNFQVQNSLFHGWQARSNTGADGKAILLAARLPILHSAVLKACDALDGQVDQLITTPGACHFDPATLQCRVGQDRGTCLTAQEVAVVRRLYDGPRDPATGERLTVGGPQFGSELAWAGVFVPEFPDQPIMSEEMALAALRNLVFEDSPSANFQLGDLRFDRATLDRLRPRHPLFDATDPDLSAFAKHGGKLILWHGWADQHISPLNTVAYHEALRAQMGTTRAAGFERLYLFPGVYHCSGGEGPSQFDLLTPLMSWVERGRAPESVLTRQARSGGRGGSRPPGAPPRSRPVYPYPFVADYKGTGDPDKASSYRRGKPLAAQSVPSWAGSDFYRPYKGAVTLTLFPPAARALPMGTSDRHEADR